MSIPANYAQDLLNVEITPGGKSVKKRDGYALAFALNSGSSAVHGVYSFYESSGSDVSLFFNDRNMSASISGGSPTVLFSTGPFGASWQCVDSAGFAYCANTSRASIIKTNGTSHTNLPVTSTGTMLAITPERLVQGGFLTAPSRVDFSKANDFTTWTVGGQDSDPITFTITAPGARITHIVYAHNRVYWFKESSFGFILEGTTQADWVVQTVNSFIGTLYNTSIYRDDILYFQGQDGHFYAWDGASLTKLSRDIQTTISLTQGRLSNSWTQTAASEWNLGSFDTGLFVDTTTVSGNIQTVFPETFSSARDGNSGTRNVWSSFIFNNLTMASQSLNSYVSTGVLTFDIPNTSSETELIRTSSRLRKPTSAGTTYYFDVTNYTGSGNPVFRFALQDVAVTSLSDLVATGNWWTFSIGNSTSTGNTSLTNSCGLSASAPAAYSLPAAVSFFVSSTFYNLQVNGVVRSSGTHSCTTMGEPYAYLWKSGYLTSGSGTTVIDNFSVTAQTFTFVSQVKNAPSLTSWDVFSTNGLNSGGTQTFSMRSATNSFTVNSSTPSWTTVTVSAVPSLSTGTYFQVRDYFETTSTNSLSLSDFTVNWFEGGASDKTYATYHDNALWWAVASGAGATTNNKILRWDLINSGWFIYDLPMNGMLVRNQNLYFGGSSTGTISIFGSGTSDNGSAINAYWKSRDYFGDSPFTDKDLRNISFLTNSVVNSSMTVTYTLNGSSSTSYVLPLYQANSSFTKYNRNLPLGSVGTTFNLKFGNNAIDQDFEVFGAQIGYTPKSWKPSQ